MANPDKFLKMAFVAALSLGSSFPLQAQDSGPRDPETIRGYRQLARCVEANAPDDVGRLLNQFYWAARELKAVRRISKSQRSCRSFGVNAKEMEDELVRGSFASAAFLRKHEDDNLPDYSQVPNIAEYELRILNGSNSSSIEFSQNILLHRKLFSFGECVFRKMPESVRGLLRTEPATAAESQSIAELKPSLSFCLAMEKATQISFTRLFLRGILGEAAYAVDSDFATQSASQVNR